MEIRQPVVEDVYVVYIQHITDIVVIERAKRQSSLCESGWARELLDRGVSGASRDRGCGYMHLCTCPCIGTGRCCSVAE